MKTYYPINFADVFVVDDLENQEALKKRKAYVEHQIGMGLYEKLIAYRRDSLDNNLWKNLILCSEKIIELSKDAYRKHQDDAYILFQLEQVLGRVEYLFDERQNATESIYEETLRQVEALCTQLSGQESNTMRYIGVSLMILGITAIVVSVLLASVPTFGGIFVAALTKAGLLSVSTSIGVAFGFSGAAASIAGATIVGDVAGTTLIGCGLFSFYRGQQKGLSLATSILVDNMSNIEATLDYFDKAISKKLYEEDYLNLREELKSLLNTGFDPVVLKKALEWANNSHNNFGPLSGGDYETFFKRLADICCVPMSYWVRYERISKESWPDLLIQNSNQLISMNNAKTSFFTLYGRHTCSVSTLQYFDDFIIMMLADKVRGTIREGLQRLMNRGFNSSDIKGALEWAKARYDHHAQTQDLARSKNYNCFFERVVDICGVMLEVPVPVPVRLE